MISWWQRAAPALQPSATLTRVMRVVGMGGARGVGGHLRGPGQHTFNRSIACTCMERVDPHRAAVATAAAAGGQKYSTSQFMPAYPEIEVIGKDDVRLARGNRIALKGRLGSDMKVVPTVHGNIGQLNVAVTPKWKEPDYVEWHTVELLGDLAQQGQEQLRKGMLVHVLGDVRVESWTAPNGDMRAQVVVEADEILMVERRAASSVTTPTPMPQQADNVAEQYSATPSATSVQPATGRMSPEREVELWAELQSNQASFWDNRFNKRNPKAPDYKHKQTGEALWLSSRGAPEWTAHLRLPEHQ